MEESDRLSKVIGIGHEISQVKDLDVLLERILTEARGLVNADAGSIYLKEGERLKFSHTQNDTLQKKLAPGRKLIYSTFTVPVNTDTVAGYVAQSGRDVNIPDAYAIPGDAPYGFDRQYDELSGYRTQSVLAFPLRTQRGRTVGVLQLINARGPDGKVAPFSASDEPLERYFADTAAVAVERALMTRDIVLRMIRMAELRDPKETGAHVNRVGAYAVEIYETWARRRGIDEETIQRNRDVLRISAMLHDVGKVAISDAILKKPARLDPDEMAVMQQHTYLGARLFSDIFSDFDESAYLIALNHHEKWDGTGYPGHVNPATGRPVPGCETPDGRAQGKKGDEIPPFGRVTAIADVYDALSCRRVYKEAWDESRVLETLRGDSGTHFDPQMIEAFFDCLETLRAAARRYPD